MISFKRLLCIILVVITVSGIFMIYNFNEERDTQIETRQKERQPAQWLQSTEPLAVENNEIRLIICGRNGEEPYASIYKNVISIVEDLKIPYRKAVKIDFSQVESGDVLVFCRDNLSQLADPMKLGDFISHGGRVILAAGLAEGTDDSYLTPFLGIEEKSVRENYNTLYFPEILWPYQPDKITFDGYNMSTWIKLRNSAVIYAQDSEKGVPLVYTYAHDQGNCCVINGTFLSEPSSMGLFTGAISAVCDEFLYPVVGTKSVFLDNFPMVTYVNDALCMKMYGCVTEAFVRDIVWPHFQGMGLRTNTVYSSGVLVEGPAPTRFPEIHESLFVTIGKSALQFDGEFIYAGYASETGAYSYNHKFMEKFRTTFPNYQIRGFANMSPEFNGDMLNIPDTKITVVRTDIRDRNAFQGSDGYYCFPQLSKGNQVDGDVLWPIASLHAAYGMLSHTFDVNTLIAEDENTASWDRDKLQLGKFEENVLSHMSYLEPCTLSQTGDRVKSYNNMQYVWKMHGEKLTLETTGAMKGQTFFFHTHNTIEQAEGAEYKKINDGYYLLRMQNVKATLTLK